MTFLTIYAHSGFLNIRKSGDDMKRLNRPTHENPRSSPEPKARSQDKEPWRVTDTMDAWWEKMTGEDKYTQDRRARLEELETDPRAQIIQVSPTQAATSPTKAGSVGTSLENMERFKNFEDEWKKRKDDMIQTRRKLSELDQERQQMYGFTDVNLSSKGSKPKT